MCKNCQKNVTEEHFKFFKGFCSFYCKRVYKEIEEKEQTNLKQWEQEKENK